MARPYIKATGFKNAIIARDAPSLEEDRTWSPQDARHSVIRWLAQARANAIGPNIYDPRSGEVMAAHIQILPMFMIPMHPSWPTGDLIKLLSPGME